jgi:hypothetical protein
MFVGRTRGRSGRRSEQGNCYAAILYVRRGRQIFSPPLPKWNFDTREPKALFIGQQENVTAVLVEHDEATAFVTDLWL